MIRGVARLGWVAGLAVGAVLATGAAATSQDAPAKGEPAVPEPARCAVEPRPIADLEPYAGNGNANVGVAIAAASPAAAEENADRGEPADPDAAAAATETIETLHACYNANDYPRAFALFTDAGLARVAPGFGLTEKDLAFLAEQPDPPPAPKEAWRAVAVREVTTLPDGRLRVAFEERAPDGASTGVAVLVETDGGYRIDDLATTPTAPDGDGAAKPGS